MTAFRTVIMLVIVFVVGAFAVGRMQEGAAEDERTPLAQCLAENGVTMYGAYWCPHCAKQKKTFGKAFRFVDYVECAIPGNQRAQTQECKDAGISSYPTWEFADGARVTGEMTLVALAERAGCPYPGADTATSSEAASTAGEAMPVPGLEDAGAEALAAPADDDATAP